MTIYVNSRKLDEHGLTGRMEARKRVGFYTETLLRLLERSAKDELDDGRCAMVREILELHIALYENGSKLEPPADLARDGEKKGRVESFLRRMQTRFIRAVCEGYVQQQELFNTYLGNGLTLGFLQVFGWPENLKGWEEQSYHLAYCRPEWDSLTAKEVIKACHGASCLVLGIPSMQFLEELQESARLVLALDPCEETVVKVQSRMLPAWCVTRLVSILPLADGGADLVLVTRTHALSAGELRELCIWAANHLPEGGRMLIDRSHPKGIGLVEIEGWTRPHTRAFLTALMEGHGFEVCELRLGNRVFIQGSKLISRENNFQKEGVCQ